MGPPPIIKATEKLVIQIRKLIIKVTGKVDLKIGISIKRKKSNDWMFKDLANLNCSIGIEFHANNKNLIASGRLKKIFINIMPLIP